MTADATLLGIARRAGMRKPMETLERAEISLEEGVARDFRGRPGKRQVTLLSRQAWEAANAELGRTTPEALLPWTVRRANLLVDGLDLAETVGRRLRIGSNVELEITGETDPCSRMEEQVPGLLRALTPEWRGGVTARVLRGGPVSIGDRVAWSE